MERNGPEQPVPAAVALRLGEETGRHHAFLDGWRGVAIGTVIAGHFLFETICPRLGTLGVQLFFVLSGRLMAEILFVRHADLARFYVRRLSRVVPALAVFALACAAAFARAGGGYPVGAKAVVAALTFTINYAMIYSHVVLMFDHLWSLCVEEHSYVLLSLVALAARPGRLPVRAALAALWLLATVNGIVRVDAWGDDRLRTLWRTDVSVAMIAASACLYLLLRSRAVPRLLCAPLLLLGAVLATGASSFAVSFGAGTACLAGAVAVVDGRSLVVGRLFSRPWLGRLGQVSFSLYLWQQPFYKLHRYGAAPLWLLLPLAIATGLASFRFVEQPARRAVNAGFERWRAERAGRAMNA